MATPSEIIDVVLSRLERPDLRSYAESKFSSALASAHSISKFSRDLEDTLLTDIVNDSGRVSLSRTTALPRLREIYSIHEWQDYTEITPGVIVPAGEIGRESEFVLNKTLVKPKDYYGFERSKIYTILGNQIVLQGVETQTQAVQILYLQWPLLEVNPSSGALETNSWIAEDFSYLVEAYLEKEVVTITRDSKAIQAAMSDVAMKRHDFLVGNQVEILS